MESTKPTLGKGLREVREAKKLSLREVEDATGISNAYLSQLENDKVQKPSPHFLHKLAKLYEIEFEFLMDAAGYVKAREHHDAPKTLIAAALLRQATLTPEEETQLANYLAFIRGNASSPK